MGLESVCHLFVLLAAVTILCVEVVNLAIILRTLNEVLQNTEDVHAELGLNEAEQQELSEALSSFDSMTSFVEEKGGDEDQLLLTVANDPGLRAGLYGALMLLLALSRLFRVFPADIAPRRDRIREAIFALAFCLTAVLFFVVGDNGVTSILMTWIVSLILGWDSVEAVRRNRSVKTILPRVILLILVLLNLIFLADYPVLLLAAISLNALKHLIKISFSQINMTVHRRIIRKTYAAEILLGMVVLIIAFSILLTLFDPGITTFGNALWYCFALVTTIGFGDITATSVLGRVLSVFLGVYGIIVVALITSIIVNFYNEDK